VVFIAFQVKITYSLHGETASQFHKFLLTPP